MKFEVLQEELLKGLALVLRAVSARTQLPVLSAIKIEAGKAGLVLSATDLEIGISTTVFAKVVEEGVVAVPGKTLNELLITLKPGKLTVEVKEQAFGVKAEGFVGKIMTVEVADFPKLPEFSETLIETTAHELNQGIVSVGFASAKDSLRPVLTGVLMELTDRLGLVATDGFRLSAATVGIKGTTATQKTTLLLPARALVEVSKIMKEGTIAIAYIPESKQALFKNDSTLFISQIIEGNFPDYNKILPKEFVVEMTVSLEELLAAVKTTLVFARDNSNMMRWNVKPGVIEISSSASGSGEGVVKVPAKVEGEGVEVVFNAKYVLDYLLLASGESVWVGLGGKLAPGMIAESVEGRDKAFYVVMPINV